MALCSDNKWYLFDDECVTPIDDLNGPDLYDEEGERLESPKAKKKPSAGFKRTADGDIMPQSQDAYMLIYTKRSDAASAAPTMVAQGLVPPPLAAARVEQLDAEYEKKKEEYEEK